MGRSLHSMIPDAATVLSLEPEELAGVLLQHLAELNENDQNINRYNFVVAAEFTFAGYPSDAHDSLAGAFMEAWSWLEAQGLIVARPEAGLGGEWYRLSRRGRRIVEGGEFATYLKAASLPTDSLHPSLRESVGPLFLRGNYDTAVFQAFKEVEVAVRNAAGLTAADFGAPLMRKAFDKNTGALRDRQLIDSEREAMAHLFAGAIGVFKNPQSHRHVALQDPKEAAEMIMFASCLLRIVDSNRK
jgi:uncharacterized protein (TIGR02391 family)